MEKARFEEIKTAIREQMYDDTMIAELLAWADAQQLIIDALRADLERHHAT